MTINDGWKVTHCNIQQVNWQLVQHGSVQFQTPHNMLGTTNHQQAPNVISTPSSNPSIIKLLRVKCSYRNLMKSHGVRARNLRLDALPMPLAEGFHQLQTLHPIGRHGCCGSCVWQLSEWPGKLREDGQSWLEPCAFGGAQLVIGL